MVFWVVTLLLILVAVLVAIVPLLNGNKKTVDERTLNLQQDANLASYYEQQAELELRLADQSISHKEAERLKLELEKKLLAELPDPGANKARQSSLSFRTAIFLSALIPLTALAIYSRLGAQTELAVTDVLRNENATFQEVVTSIEGWVDKQPENTQALYLLGSNYLSMGRLDDAVAVYRKLYGLSGQHPQVSAQLAQVLFLSGDQTISDEVRRLYLESLAMEPANTTALGLKGIDAFEKSRYSDAINAWQMALESENDPQARQALVSGISRARMMMGEQLTQVTVRVDVSPELKSLPADTRVIIFARESGTQSAPVAAVPATVGELPKEIILDDSSAMMMGGRSLADISKLDIIARVTLSGDAMRSDYQAVVPGVDPTEKKLVKLEIMPSSG